MNLLTSVELHQCGQIGVIITIITEDVTFFWGEVLSTAATFITFFLLSPYLLGILLSSSL